MMTQHLSPRVRAYVEKNRHSSLTPMEWDELVTHTVFEITLDSINHRIEVAAKEAHEALAIRYTMLTLS